MSSYVRSIALAVSGAGGEGDSSWLVNKPVENSAWHSSPNIPSESESQSEAISCMRSMDSPIALMSMNASFALEYLVDHNRTRPLSQTSSTKQPSDSLTKSTA